MMTINPDDLSPTTLAGIAADLATSNRLAAHQARISLAANVGEAEAEKMILDAMAI